MSASDRPARPQLDDLGPPASFSSSQKMQPQPPRKRRGLFFGSSPICGAPLAAANARRDSASAFAARCGAARRSSPRAMRSASALAARCHSAAVACGSSPATLQLNKTNEQIEDWRYPSHRLDMLRRRCILSRTNSAYPCFLGQPPARLSCPQPNSRLRRREVSAGLRHRRGHRRPAVRQGIRERVVCQLGFPGSNALTHHIFRRTTACAS